jgi:predicted DNA-binding protein (MmcQ/YjbR family)
VTLGMKMSRDRQGQFLDDPRFFPTPYAAHQGWVSVLLQGQTDWDEIDALLREAYRQVALKRMLKALE